MWGRRPKDIRRLPMFPVPSLYDNLFGDEELPYDYYEYEDEVEFDHYE